MVYDIAYVCACACVCVCVCVCVRVVAHVIQYLIARRREGERDCIDRVPK